MGNEQYSGTLFFRMCIVSETFANNGCLKKAYFDENIVNFFLLRHRLWFDGSLKPEGENIN